MAPAMPGPATPSRARWGRPSLHIPSRVEAARHGPGIEPGLGQGPGRLARSQHDGHLGWGLPDRDLPPAQLAYRAVLVFGAEDGVSTPQGGSGVRLAYIGAVGHAVAVAEKINGHDGVHCFFTVVGPPAGPLAIGRGELHRRYRKPSWVRADCKDWSKPMLV